MWAHVQQGQVPLPRISSDSSAGNSDRNDIGSNINSYKPSNNNDANRNNNNKKLGNLCKTFEELCPIDTNNGAAIFTQYCLNKLSKNGMLAIVLPYGELFTGNTFIKMRKWMIDNFNLK